MTKPRFASVEFSATALDMLAHDYVSLDLARADNAAFICIDCGTIVFVTPDATSSREDQQLAIAGSFVVECCGAENMFLI
jgi:hypothetical protein